MPAALAPYRDKGYLRRLSTTPAAPAVQNGIARRWPGSVHLLVLAAYAVVLSVLASRVLRWTR